MVTRPVSPINRLHALLAQLIPAGLPRGLTADTAAGALCSIRPRAVLARTVRQVAAELLSEVRRLDRRIAEATAALSAAVAASGTTLTDLHGIGDVIVFMPVARWRDRAGCCCEHSGGSR